jgi:hypothetical protein
MKETQRRLQNKGLELRSTPAVWISDFQGKMKGAKNKTYQGAFCALSLQHTTE